MFRGRIKEWESGAGSGSRRINRQALYPGFYRSLCHLETGVRSLGRLLRRGRTRSECGSSRSRPLTRHPNPGATGRLPYHSRVPRLPTGRRADFELPTPRHHHPLRVYCTDWTFLFSDSPRARNVPSLGHEWGYRCRLSGHRLRVRRARGVVVTVEQTLVRTVPVYG